MYNFSKKIIRAKKHNFSGSRSLLNDPETSSVDPVVTFGSNEGEGTGATAGAAGGLGAGAAEEVDRLTVAVTGFIPAIFIGFIPVVVAPDIVF